MAHGVVWVDIPVADLDRAARFYSAVLGAPVKLQSRPGMMFGMLPHDRDNEVGGCLFLSQKLKPSQDGPLIYLGVPGRLADAEAAVEPQGGRVLQSRHAIDPFGYRTVILDSEGNRVALHAM